MSYAAVGEDEILTSFASKVKAGTAQLPTMTILAQRSGLIAPDAPASASASEGAVGNDLVVFVGLGVAVLAVGGAVLLKMSRAK